MLCPTCFQPYEPPVVVQHDDSAYRAKRRAEAAEVVASYRATAATRDQQGRHEAARVWSEEADKLEAECARVWGV